MTVRPDGRISLPLLNDVEAAGSRPTSSARKISGSRGQVRRGSDRHGRREADQQPARCSSPGRWESPGRTRLAAPTTVLQLIAMAGGVNEFADAEHIVILRTENGKATSIDVQLQGRLKRKKLAAEHRAEAGRHGGRPLSGPSGSAMRPLRYPWRAALAIAIVGGAGQRSGATAGTSLSWARSGVVLAISSSSACRASVGGPAMTTTCSPRAARPSGADVSDCTLTRGGTGNGVGELSIYLQSRSVCGAARPVGPRRYYPTFATNSSGATTRAAAVRRPREGLLGGRARQVSAVQLPVVVSDLLGPGTGGVASSTRTSRLSEHYVSYARQSGFRPCSSRAARH